MGLTSFVAELGEVVERNLRNRPVFIVLLLIAAFFHVVCFILLVILMLAVYARSQKGPIPLRPKRDEKETTTIVVGLSIFGIGLYYLIRIYIPEFGWQLAFLLVGSLLIAFGISRGGEIRETTS